MKKKEQNESLLWIEEAGVRDRFKSETDDEGLTVDRHDSREGTDSIGNIIGSMSERNTTGRDDLEPLVDPLSIKVKDLSIVREASVDC